MDPAALGEAPVEIPIFSLVLPFSAHARVRPNGAALLAGVKHLLLQNVPAPWRIQDIAYSAQPALASFAQICQA
jgi:hypothetical protein